MRKKKNAENQQVTKKMQKKCKNIWSCQKKAVPLHSLLRNKCVSIFSQSLGIKIKILLGGPNFFAPK